ncbi:MULTISPECIES: CPBP family intramembrane glutamic endopeptidase [unclassified Treponema]|uniref:CPBP family intramembrane glutamic endopeptidase n=1 Tax=unclassified Treponema TaxID=2638727 RepID=UPI0020A264CC|nr:MULTISPECIES: CPBP family intramembrane glutamic endopeptidase [unclassified Treponema]UTC68338.1 CPBP family intramembrane metalloprotease [Treponema sp. OMZ 789]UTC71058.1 CPBP family intramembrane metalloprotease [Treponema sp. OMZ 790]UTC73799.1 CPBP family intramembrane metalloprotease [Treponema sp. OMZ 791]
MNKKVIKDLCILFILYILAFLIISYTGKFLFKNFYNYYYILFVKYNGIFGSLLFLLFIIIFYLFYSKDLKIIFTYKKLNLSVIVKGLIYLSSITMIYYIISFIFDNSFLFNFFKYFNDILTGKKNITVYDILILEKLQRPRFEPFMLISTVIIGPVFEEIFYRGLMYNKLKEISNDFIAVFISSMFFAFLHIPGYGFNIKMFSLVLDGILLAYCYEKTNNIYVPILIHSINNFFIFLFRYVYFYFLIVIYFIVFIIALIILTIDISKCVKMRKSLKI